MEPVLTAAVIIKGIYGACGMYSCWQLMKFFSLRAYLIQNGRQEDAEAVNKHYNWWKVPAFVAIFLVWIS